MVGLVGAAGVLALAVVVASAAARLGHEATRDRSDETPPLCVQLVAAGRTPDRWLDERGKLTVAPGPAGELMLVFGIGAVYERQGHDDAEGLDEATLRDLLATRARGEAVRPSAAERAALDDLARWQAANC